MAELSGWIGEDLRTISGEIPKIEPRGRDLAHDWRSEALVTPKGQ